MIGCMGSVKTYSRQVSQSILIYCFQLTHFKGEKKSMEHITVFFFFLLVHVLTAYATDQINF